MAALRLIVTVIVLAVITVVMMPLQLVATRFEWPIAAKIPQLWQKVARRLVGIRVSVMGTPAAPPLLIAANHISWLDITVIGSVLPVSYISKAEVATWPVIGLLARLQRSVFIDRTRRTETKRATEAVASRIGKGDIMVLFAEGTTGDGTRVLPFRSSLIGAAGAAISNEPITVQPLAIAYTRIQGLPVGRTDLPDLAWYGDMPFGSHFRDLLMMGAIDTVVAFGEPIVLGPEHDRKQVADLCFAEVKRMLAEIRENQPSSGGRQPYVFQGGGKGAKAAAKPAAASETAPGG
jgi:lyso-ornithine lipid O-acyltransferase